MGKYRRNTHILIFYNTMAGVQGSCEYEKWTGKNFRGTPESVRRRTRNDLFTRIDENTKHRCYFCMIIYDDVIKYECYCDKIGYFCLNCCNYWYERGHKCKITCAGCKDDYDVDFADLTVFFKENVKGKKIIWGYG